jgi:glyoxylate reductase
VERGATPKVFVTRRVDQEALDLLERHAQVTVWEDQHPPPREVLLSRASNSHGLLTMLTDPVDEELLSRAPDLVVVSNMATGLDNVDVAACTRHGVLVGSTPGVLAKTCAELAFALLLAVARRVVEGDRFVRDGSWEVWHPSLMLGRDLHGATLGIVGLGAIGLEVARRARAFEMEVVYYQRRRRLDAEVEHGLRYAPDLPTLLRGSDFVTIHAPLTPETRHMIGAAELRMMRPYAMLVNTSRGQLVDQEALAEALRGGAIAGAALDVMEQEPVPLDDPLLGLPNLLMTPHTASASVATRRRMAVMAAQNILAALRGDPMPACANPGVLESR